MERFQKQLDYYFLDGRFHDGNFQLDSSQAGMSSWGFYISPHSLSLVMSDVQALRSRFGKFLNVIKDVGALWIHGFNPFVLKMDSPVIIHLALPDVLRALTIKRPGTHYTVSKVIKFSATSKILREINFHSVHFKLSEPNTIQIVLALPRDGQRAI